MSAIQLTILHKFLPKFAAILDAIPGKQEDQDCGTMLVKTFAELIASKIGTKNPDQQGLNNLQIIFNEVDKVSVFCLARRSM